MRFHMRPQLRTKIRPKVNLWPLFFLLPALCCSGCGSFQTKGDHFGAYKISYDGLSGWEQDNHAEALHVFLASCPILARKARSASSGSGLEIPEPVWKALCEDARHVTPGDEEQAKLFFERRFQPFRVTNNDKEKGLFTGYYEPLLYGSRVATKEFAYALYSPPPELRHKKPYFTHAQIDNGVLKNHGLELVWVDDPVMLFFMQIQGSGHVQFADGSRMLVGYADQNGHEYVSLGKIMGDEGLIPKDQINFFTLRQWLYSHPDQAFTMMERNPSYVFFKRLNTAEPVGAVGSALTPQRSIAVDSHYIPYGLPVFMETDLPALFNSKPTPFHRVMIAQDTGGAIRGPVRADIFFGEGQTAEYLAGYMKGHGVYSVLVPKEVAYQLK